MAISAIHTAGSADFFTSDDSFQAELKRLTEVYEPDACFVLTDANTYKLCWPKVDKLHGRLSATDPFILQPGEASKTFSVIESLCNHLICNGASRKSLLINLGGGVVSDTGGFAASVYQRGIRFINVPTSLMAMADAALGGKNGINIDGLKNQAGTFTLPEKVLIYPEFLKTLPNVHIRNGWAEMLKHALIADAHHWHEIRRHSPVKDGIPLAALMRSTEIKNAFVLDDFREDGRRAALNFGHTIGHALEGLMMQKNEDQLMHGEAVAQGMVIESILSVHLGFMKEDVFRDICKTLFAVYPKPVNYPKEFKKLEPFIKADKKRDRSAMKFTLLKEPGECITGISVKDNELQRALKAYDKL